MKSNCWILQQVELLIGGIHVKKHMLYAADADSKELQTLQTKLKNKQKELQKFSATRQILAPTNKKALKNCVKQRKH